MAIFCSKCGRENDENRFQCAGCGFVLHSSSPGVVADDGTLGGLIPYKNSQALISYYLGVFSLIPCLGILTGIAALILGIRGLKFADLHPQAKGKGHAWAGIILGGICSVGYTLLIAVPVVLAIINSKK